jgi:protease I
MAQQVKVACLLGDGFEDSEFRSPYDALKAAGHAVDVIGAEVGQELKGKAGKEKVKVEKAISDVRPEDYGLLFIPGGYSPDHLRGDARFTGFVKAYDALRRPVAAICHGPQLMMSAGIVKQGRTLTAWQTVQRDLEYTGATVKDEPVVVDGNWVTSRKPDDLPRFNEATLKALR